MKDWGDYSIEFEKADTKVRISAKGVCAVMLLLVMMAWSVIRMWA
ncbi:hypothetical protein jaqu_35620 [Jannaschia aquimarina]|uniref:Uncharacterized protein n=1 Tax=Jannaschia aquimarina TaxID=935700 RepID=A0A0D1D3N8_9RHOB|nr:hypothetical protein jaqu_35620 [Jannaschia aquimarina]SNT44158.1 hypothetical protein SAMN05421775_1265 [Jannaschia aquimarina]